MKCITRIIDNDIESRIDNVSIRDKSYRDIILSNRLWNRYEIVKKYKALTYF